MPSSTVTSKGQITIPAEFRRALGIRPGARVYMKLEDGTIRVDPCSYTDRTAGMFKGRLPRPATIKEEKEAAAEGWVESAMQGAQD